MAIVPALPGLPDVEVMLLSAVEIASALLQGDMHLGITGEDLLREEAPELKGRMHLISLWALALPMWWWRYRNTGSMSRPWLIWMMSAPLMPQTHRRRLRVATKYAQLTRGFFAHAGISDYRIVPSAGATEGAPAAGTAEVIVDITTTGRHIARQWP